jgi:hypothetical protein
MEPLGGDGLKFFGEMTFAFVLLIGLAVIIAFFVLCVLLIKALVRYVKSKDVREEKAIIKKSLGEVLKQHREDCKMTQEFVAEAIGVSRQAVSKWENGTSDPSTSNLIALAKLFELSAEELLHEIG